MSRSLCWLMGNLNLRRKNKEKRREKPGQAWTSFIAYLSRNPTLTQISFDFIYHGHVQPIIYHACIYYCKKSYLECSNLSFQLFKVSIYLFQIILKVLKVVLIVCIWSWVRPVLRYWLRFLGFFGKEVLHHLLEAIISRLDSVSI